MAHINISLDVLLYNIFKLNPLVKICFITNKNEYPSPPEETSTLRLLGLKYTNTKGKSDTKFHSWDVALPYSKRVLDGGIFGPPLFLGRQIPMQGLFKDGQSTKINCPWMMKEFFFEASLCLLSFFSMARRQRKNWICFIFLILSSFDSMAWMQSAQQKT